MEYLYQLPRFFLLYTSYLLGRNFVGFESTTEWLSNVNRLLVKC